MKIILSPEEIDSIRLARWRARTDLGYLCREVLGYKHVEDYVHGPIMKCLQGFPKPKSRKEFEEHDFWDGRTWHYKPLFNHIQDLPGSRRRLVLAFRGLMKTTVNLQAHTMQWIINYPSVAIAIFQSNLEKSEDILKSIRYHFRYNDVFRRLFPEHCPTKSIDEWGVNNEITTCARPRTESRREPTVKALSIDKENAGYHFDVLKFSDIVEPGTTKTEGAMENTIKQFSLAESLLVTPVYWMDVEGTRYHAKELYQDLIDRWMDEYHKGLPHEYDCVMQGCFKLADPVTKKEQTTFGPDTLGDDWKPLLDANGKRIPWWPKDNEGAPRYPLEALEAKERNTPYEFASQYLIQPSKGDNMQAFPLDKIEKITLANYKRHVEPKIQHYTIGLDTAQKVNDRANHSAFVVCGWDPSNRAYVVEIVRKKLQPSEIVKWIFDLNAKYRPQSFVIEETGFVTGLSASIDAELVKQKPYMIRNKIPWNLDLIPADNQQKKESRIRNTLQPWVLAGNLRFVQPIYDTKDPAYNEEAVQSFEAMLKEFRDYPRAASDDILDALADQFQTKTQFGRLAPRSMSDVTEAEFKLQFEKFLGVDRETVGTKRFPIGLDRFRAAEFF